MMSHFSSVGTQNRLRLRLCLLVVVAVSTTIRGAAQGQGQVVGGTHLTVPEPTGSCALDTSTIRDTLNLAAASPPATVTFSAGQYCLDDHLALPSNIAVHGAGTGMNSTLLRQSVPGESLFLISGRYDVTISDLRLELDDGQDQGSLASSGVAVYGSEHVTLERLHIVGGKQGIYLSDSPFLRLTGAGEDLCTLGDLNQAIAVHDCIIEGARVANISIRNASYSDFARNHLSGVRTAGLTATADGIKIGCGPVEENRVAYNYITGNSRDGLDAAWQIQSDGGPVISDPADGPFRGNRIEFNIFYGNCLIGLAIKSGAGSGEVPPFCEESIVQVGSNVIRRNIAVNNDFAEMQLQDSAPRTNDPCIKDLPENLKTHFEENVLWRQHGTCSSPDNGSTESGGLNLHRSFNIRVFRNWIAGHWLGPAGSCDLAGDDNNCEIGLSGGNHPAPDPEMRFISIDRNFIEESGIHQDDAVLPPNPTGSLPPTDRSREALIGRKIFQAGNYHCRDNDDDGCPNGCEPLIGRDPLIAEVPGECNCGSFVPFCPSKQQLTDKTR